MDSATLAKDEKSQIIQELARFPKDVNMVVDTASHVLSSISSQLGVVLAPKFNKGKISQIELIPLSEDNLLVIFKIELGLVKTIIVEINRRVPTRLLETMKEILNERLHGLSVAEIQKLIDERFDDVDSETRILLNLIKEETDKKLNVNLAGDVKFSGARNFIYQPEFGTREKVGRILELLDRQDILIRLLDGTDSEGVSIVIGEENEETLMKNCSLITTTYRLEGAQGTLGVIGPTRMQYAKIVALVQFMSELLGYLMSKPDIDTDKVISDL
jgi:heat-inducible transcriptional repressor